MKGSARAPVVAALLLSPLVGCSFIGVEPDVIGEGESSDAFDGGPDEAEDTSDSDATGMSTTATGGDGDGDSSADSSGDGDGDSGSSSGDGDGDLTTGDGDGDGDGDTGADPSLCEELEPTPLEVGPNPFAFMGGTPLMESDCGQPGPEMVFSYVADFDGQIELTLVNPDFEAALYAIASEVCFPVDALACVNPPEALIVDVIAGETVYIVVDAAELVGGSGDLVLAAL